MHPVWHDPSRRRLLQAAAATAALALSPRGQAQPAAPAASTLQIVGPWEIGGLHPASSGYLFTRLQVAETLLAADDNGTPCAALAQRWQVSADGLRWQFQLRPGARFHDGTALTADAVVHALLAAQRPPSVLSGAAIAGIETLGPLALQIRLAQPLATLPALLAHSSSLVLAPASYDREGTVQRIVGSGPYRVTRLAPPQRVELEHHAQYDGPPPAITRVRYLSAGRAETRALMAEGGDADLAYGLDPASVQRLRLRPHLRIERITLPRTVIVKLNAGLPALRDRRVRDALSLAIDRSGIARAILREPSLAATQLLAPTLSGWHNPALPDLPYAPGTASQRLLEAGWRRQAGGWLDADGRPVRLKLHTFPDRPELPIIATALQEEWRQIGIPVQLSIGNSGDIPLGHRDGSLQMALAARNYANVPDPASTLAQDFSGHGSDWGAMQWHDDALDQALQRLLRGERDAAMQQTLQRTVTGILQRELPVIPVCWSMQQVAVNRRVEQVSLDPLECSYRISQMRWRT